MILKFADTVIRKNKARYEKSLVSGRHGDKGKVTFIRSDNAEDQFEVIKGLVEKNPHDWAILSRNNTTLDKMESYLEVPVSRIGEILLGSIRTKQHPSPLLLFPTAK